jgi:hypothetical protein
VRTAAIVIAALAVALGTAPAASADPPVPQDGTPCLSAIANVMTWPLNAKMPLVCRDDRWQVVTTPPPPNDRWLSVGPAMTLHGEGLRNPSVSSGNWTATPQDPGTQCRAAQQTVVGPGVVSTPQVSEAKAGQPLSLQLPPRLFSIEMSGYCLWTRTAG